MNLKENRFSPVKNQNIANAILNQNIEHENRGQLL